MDSALEIESGAELERFDLGTVTIKGKDYVALTGHEGTGKCFWCGGELKGKLRRYCYGHMAEYYRHFEWSSARSWCGKRQDWICANCGKHCGRKLEVHHIVPLKGSERFFSAHNLPWNLIGFCHDCHWAVHAAMRPYRSKEQGKQQIDVIEYAQKVGQGMFDFLVPLNTVV